MPLTFASAGVENSIKRINGRDEAKRFLENLGFVVGGTVTVVSEHLGDVIVNVKNTRVAISREMANRILI